MRKTNQIDIDLNQIQDPGVRTAMRSMMDFVSELVGRGLETDQKVKALEFENHNKRFTVDRKGRLTALSFRAYGSGAKNEDGVEVPSYVKMAVREGDLAASGSINFTIEGKVLGVIGWTEDTGGGSTAMHPMAMLGGVIPSDQNYFSTAGASSTDTVRVLNSDAVNANRYRVLIFYAEDI